MITQTHDLNLIPGSVPPVVNVTQFDKTARTLVFNLWDGETSFSVPSGAAVTIRGAKPDGNGFEYTATASGSAVSMNIQQQMATCAGSVRCEVRITSGTQILGTADFILEVKPSALNENTPLSETELPLIEEAGQYAAEALISRNAAAEYAKQASDSAEAAVKNYFDPIASFNAAFRGKNLGSTVTDAQYADIKNGTFKLVRLGDYWAINGQNYRVAAIDWFLHAGDNIDLGHHHVVIVPDNCLLSPDGSTTKYMQDTDTTDGGYVGSKMYKTTLPGVLKTLQGIFGSKIMKHREILCNAVSNGASSGWSWYDSYVECMDEVMVYGSTVWSAGGYNTGIGYGQLPLFALRHEFINHRQPAYWLRDVASASWFAYVHFNGVAAYNVASAPWLGVRPYFLIG